MLDIFVKAVLSFLGVVISGLLAYGVVVFGFVTYDKFRYYGNEEIRRFMNGKQPTKRRK